MKALGSKPTTAKTKPGSTSQGVRCFRRMAPARVLLCKTKDTKVEMEMVNSFYRKC